APYTTIWRSSFLAFVDTIVSSAVREKVIDNGPGRSPEDLHTIRSSREMDSLSQAPDPADGYFAALFAVCETLYAPRPHGGGPAEHIAIAQRAIRGSPPGRRDRAGRCARNLAAPARGGDRRRGRFRVRRRVALGAATRRRRHRPLLIRGFAPAP